MAAAQTELTTIRILLVDDSAVFRTALARFLTEQTNLQLLGVAGTAREALDIPATLDPDIVLLDLHLPDAFGLSLLAPLAQQWPNAKIIILTSDTYPRLRQRALAAG